MENLSKIAREELNKLQAKIQEVITADKQREPKLTDDEKVEMASMEARIEKSRPIKERLLDLINSKETRLKFFEQNIHTMIIEGGDVDALVAEFELLKPAIQILSEAHRSTSMVISVAESKIQHLKEAARLREIRQEAKNGQ